jgi:hypothetical protein
VLTEEFALWFRHRSVIAELLSGNARLANNNLCLQLRSPYNGSLARFRSPMLRSTIAELLSGNNLLAEEFALASPLLR